MNAEALGTAGLEQDCCPPESSGERRCPMASMCQRMVGGEGKRPGPFLFLPGLALVAAGVALLVWPQILTWLVAVTSMLLGFVVLAFAAGVRKLAATRG